MKTFKVTISLCEELEYEVLAKDIEQARDHALEDFRDGEEGKIISENIEVTDVRIETSFMNPFGG